MIEGYAAVLRRGEDQRLCRGCTAFNQLDTHNEDRRVAVKFLLVVRLGFEPFDQLIPHEKRIVFNGDVPFCLREAAVSISMKRQELPLV